MLPRTIKSIQKLQNLSKGKTILPKAIKSFQKQENPSRSYKIVLKARESTHKLQNPRKSYHFDSFLTGSSLTNLLTNVKSNNKNKI